MNTKLLTFVNHACFYVTNDSTLLLADPWVEGPAFNNGWSLLDTSTSNAALVREIAAQHRNTFVWFSHEHPDHFSISFIKRLKQDFPGKLTLLYQHTKDRRVLDFLRGNGFTVIECMRGKPVHLDNDMAITVYPFADGDSYCLIGCGGRHILNLNDCAIATAESCRAVKASLARAGASPEIDVLLTQFGYANWIGNPFESELRRRAAAEKLQRVRLQIVAFAPAMTVPFASFVSFSNIENYYLNDCQNSPASVARWALHSAAQRCITFMKPGAVINLDTDTPSTLRASSEEALQHWQRLIGIPGELLPAEPPVAPSALRAAVAKYLRSVRSKLLFLPYLLEWAGLIRPLLIYIPDLALRIRVSYVLPYQELPADGPHDISMTSSSVVFLFSNEYGFNTTHVNGRFRTSDEAALERFSRFFMPQNLGRQGYGIQHPAATLAYLAGNVLGRSQRLLGELQRRLVSERAPRPK